MLHLGLVYCWLVLLPNLLLTRRGTKFIDNFLTEMCNAITWGKVNFITKSSLMFWSHLLLNIFIELCCRKREFYLILKEFSIKRN